MVHNFCRPLEELSVIKKTLHSVCEINLEIIDDMLLLINSDQHLKFHFLPVRVKSQSFPTVSALNRNDERFLHFFQVHKTHTHTHVPATCPPTWLTAVQHVDPTPPLKNRNTSRRCWDWIVVVSSSDTIKASQSQRLTASFTTAVIWLCDKCLGDIGERASPQTPN